MCTKSEILLKLYYPEENIQKLANNPGLAKYMYAQILFVEAKMWWRVNSDRKHLLLPLYYHLLNIIGDTVKQHDCYLITNKDTGINNQI